MRAPVFGGVQDGFSVHLPPNAEPDVYTRVLQGDGEGREQTTEYVLRADPMAPQGQRYALVARDLKWPIVEGAAA
jgi:hypothetical protein